MLSAIGRARGEGAGGNRRREWGWRQRSGHRGCKRVLRSNIWACEPAVCFCELHPASPEQLELQGASPAAASRAKLLMRNMAARWSQGISTRPHKREASEVGVCGAPAALQVLRKGVTTGQERFKYGERSAIM